MVSIKRVIGRIFGRDGQSALEEKQTDNESRVGILKREFAEHPSKGLTPAKLYQILEDAEQGNLKAQHELFDDMEEKDPQIAADLGKRRQLAAELEWQIVAPENACAAEKKAADFCGEVFSGLEVEDLIIDLGSGIGHGWACLEMPWELTDGKRIVQQPIFRPHSWFRLPWDNQDELRLRDTTSEGAPLWPLGWVQHRHRAKSGYVARAGLHRVLVWPYLFQNYALGDLAELLEIYGLPARIGTYPRNATDKEKATLLRAVTSLGHRAAGIIPEGMLIDFKTAADGHSDLFETMIHWCERAKSKAILGGTLTSGTGEGTNTNALGNVHERGQQSLIRSDARQYAGSVNRDILWPMAALNYGIEDRRRAPRFYLDTSEAEDYKLLADSLPVFVDMGAQVPMWWLHEKTRIPQAAKNEATLKPKMQTTPSAALKGLAALTVDKTIEPTMPADYISDRLANDGQAAIDTWLGQIQAMLKQAESLEQFKAMLLAAYGDLNTDALASVLAAGLEAAQAAGRFDVEEAAVD